MIKKTATKEILRKQEAAVTNLDMMGASPPGIQSSRPRIVIPPVNPFPKKKDRDVGNRWRDGTSAPPKGVLDHDAREKEFFDWLRTALDHGTSAPPKGVLDHDAREKEFFDRLRTALDHGTREKEFFDRLRTAAPNKAAELRRAAAAEKKGMQEQFREWFEGGRGARARGRGGAGRRSGGRR